MPARPFAPRAARRDARLRARARVPVRRRHPRDGGRRRDRADAARLLVEPRADRARPRRGAAAGRGRGGRPVRRGADPRHAREPLQAPLRRACRATRSRTSRSRAANGELLLDIGCNWGRWTIAAAQRGYRPIGIDPSFEAIVAARRIARQLGVDDARYVVADARKLPFADGTFDVVFSYGVLQHFSKSDVALSVARHPPRARARRLLLGADAERARRAQPRSPRAAPVPRGRRVRGALLEAVRARSASSGGSAPPSSRRTASSR